MTLTPRGGGSAGGGRHRALLTGLLGALLGLGTLVVPAAPSLAHQNPATCNSNNLVLDIGRDRNVVRNGDTINYTLSASNLDSAQGNACEFGATAFTFIAPAADGTATGARTVLRSNVELSAGTTRTVLGTVPYVVAVNPGVTDTIAQGVAQGVLHDAPSDDPAVVVKSLGSKVTQPHTTLAATVALVGSATPLTANYTYTETNDSTTPLSISTISIADDQCSPVVYRSGDTNKNTNLDPGEHFVFSCHKTIAKPGTYQSHVTATGIDLDDGLAAPPENATVSMTAAAPVKFVLPVTGPAVPVVPLGGLGLALIGAGALLTRRGRSAP